MLLVDKNKTARPPLVFPGSGNSRSPLTPAPLLCVRGRGLQLLQKINIEFSPHLLWKVLLAEDCFKCLLQLDVSDRHKLAQSLSCCQTQISLILNLALGILIPKGSIFIHRTFLIKFHTNNTNNYFQTVYYTIMALKTITLDVKSVTCTFSLDFS